MRLEARVLGGRLQDLVSCDGQMLLNPYLPSSSVVVVGRRRGLLQRGYAISPRSCVHVTLRASTGLFLVWEHEWRQVLMRCSICQIKSPFFLWLAAFRIRLHGGEPKPRSVNAPRPVRETAWRLLQHTVQGSGCCLIKTARVFPEDFAKAK